MRKSLVSSFKRRVSNFFYKLFKIQKTVSNLVYNSSFSLSLSPPLSLSLSLSLSHYLYHYHYLTISLSLTISHPLLDMTWTSHQPLPNIRWYHSSETLLACCTFFCVFFCTTFVQLCAFFNIFVAQLFCAFFKNIFVAQLFLHTFFAHICCAQLLFTTSFAQFCCTTFVVHLCCTTFFAHLYCTLFRVEQDQY